MLTCLIPAFFIAGAISVFVSQAAVLKYFGAKANKILSYSVASVSGSVLAVCSCTVLPLFAGIYTRGAGIGPATGPALALLLAGPALSLPSMITIASVMGVKKTAVYCTIVVVLSTIAGMIYGFLMS